MYPTNYIKYFKPVLFHFFFLTLYLIINESCYIDHPIQYYNSSKKYFLGKLLGIKYKIPLKKYIIFS